jgi:hypothetical protein
MMIPIEKRVCGHPANRVVENPRRSSRWIALDVRTGHRTNIRTIRLRQNIESRSKNGKLPLVPQSQSSEPMALLEHVHFVQINMDQWSLDSFGAIPFHWKEVFTTDDSSRTPRYLISLRCLQNDRPFPWQPPVP